ncbi:MAG: transposase [Saprospiraceae bacterium]
MRRNYDEGFKSEALRMVNGGRSVPDVARPLGMSENLLYKWRTEQKSSYSPEGMPSWSNCASNYARLKWSGMF